MYGDEEDAIERSATITTDLEAGGKLANQHQVRKNRKNPPDHLLVQRVGFGGDQQSLGRASATTTGLSDVSRWYNLNISRIAIRLFTQVEEWQVL